MEQSGNLKTFFIVLSFGFLAFIFLGLIWFFFIGPSTPVGFGWYLFSFAAGITMIVLPCTLPLAFVIVPLSMGKGAGKGLGIAVAFSLGVALTLSIYGILAAFVGEVAIGTLGAPLETVKNWLYFAAGVFAYLFALGEIGLIKFRMPTYSGAAPAFIQKQGDYFKALLLGLFLGNIGVGCPHPATPVILTRIAASGDVFYGWSLFLVHAIGRILPLLLLALLAILGVNALKWLVARKDKIERATGWGMVFVAGFILVLGLFTHDWWVFSGQHSLWEEITQEERVLGVIVERLDLGPPPHTHGPEELVGQTGLLGLPLWLGNWVLVVLWVLPMWWYYFKRKQELRIMEREERKIEEKIMPYRFWLFVSLTALSAVTFVYYLPFWFQHRAEERVEEHMDEAMMREAHGEAQYHEEREVREGLAVNLNIIPAPVEAGASARLDFFVNQKPENVPVTDLEIEHEKLMHVIGVRNDMEEFFHVHPVRSQTPEASAVPPLAERTSNGVHPGLFTESHVFLNPGLYKIWSEVKRQGVNHAFGHPEIAVEGEGEKYNKRVGFGRNVIVGDYQVALRLGESVPAGREVDLLFDAHTLDSFEIELEDYLAAKMHLTVIKDDWRQFIHTHPEGEIDHHGKAKLISEARANGGGHDSAEAGHGVNFQVTFPEQGLYKAFAQFRPAGIALPPDEALTASFWIRVEDSKPFAFSNWWMNLAVSLVLIVLLSWGVRKYLSPRE